MTPEQPKRPDIQLPVWQEGQPEPAIDAPEGELVKFARVMDKWWNQVQAWLYWPLTGFDVDNAPLVIVDMIAWQRDIDRYPGEPEWLYRRRVKHAKGQRRGRRFDYRFQTDLGTHGTGIHRTGRTHPRAGLGHRPAEHHGKR